jgi:hypothetical protein
MAVLALITLRNSQRAVKVLTVFWLAAVLLAACATQPAGVAAVGAPGFWFGLLHGVIAPFALIGSLFYDVKIYAVPNGGWWYDFGFFLGIAGTTGGGVRYAR